MGTLTLTYGCGKSADDYFPFDEGRYWRYSMVYHTMDGTFKGVYAAENLPPQKDHDQIYYVRRLLDGSYNYFQEDDTGLKLVRREKTVDLDTEFNDSGRYLFRYPLEEGAEWEEVITSKALIKTGPPQKTEFHITARVPVTVRIESMNDTINVPAGKFTDCMRVHFKGDGFVNAGNYVGKTIVRIEETNWYAPGIGLVKSVREESTKSKALDKGEITLELEYYRR